MYGDLEGYSRVSKHLDWILEVMGNDYPGQYSGPLYSENHPSDDSNDDASTGSGGGGSIYWLSLLLIGLIGNRLMTQESSNRL